jgi:nitrite reductase/ring-hydroxylating ferredoxin subunit
MSEFVKVAGRGEIPQDRAIIVEARGRKIALINAGSAVYAIDNACRYLGGALGEGDIYGTVWFARYTDGSTILRPVPTSTTQLCGSRAS